MTNNIENQYFEDELFISPMSFGQKRLWFLNQLYPESSAYNLSMALSMKGSLQLEALHQSLDDMVERHEILRTVFMEMDGEFIQVITPYKKIDFNVTELEEASGINNNDKILEFLKQEAERPFDLSKGPLLRVGLIQLSENNHVFYANMHHIIFDRWSQSVFMEELATLYKGYSQGKPANLAELSIQYADYSYWQKEWLQGEELEKQLSYWTIKLDGVLPILQLPTDQSRSSEQTFHGKSYVTKLPNFLSHKIRELSHKEGTTTYMTLLTAFKTLLYRYTGQEDLLVGTPIAGRNQEELEGMIGFFVNTLVLRSDLSGNPSFRELLQQVRKTCLEAYNYQDLPFEKLVEELQPDREMSYSPIFQVMFVMQNSPVNKIDLPELNLNSIEIEKELAKFDLTLYVEEDLEETTLDFTYNSNLFNEQSVECMALHFIQLLEEIINDPEQRICLLPMMTKEEKQKLIVEWNNTSREFQMYDCIHRLFEKQVDASPNAIAVEFEGNIMTYNELNERANQLANYLCKCGVGPEVPVAIFMNKSLNMMVGLLGILKSGGAYIPLDPSLNNDRLSYILKDSNAQIILTQSFLLEHLFESDVLKICIDTEWKDIKLQNNDNLDVEIELDNLAYIIYTSGSTGNPKGVAIEHKGLTNYMSWCAEKFYLNDGIGSLVHSSISFDLPMTGLYPPLLVGKRVVLLSDSSNIESLINTCKQNYNFSVIKITPSHLRLINDYLSPEEMKNITKVLIIGGEVFYKEDISMWKKYSPKTLIINHYGPTEAIVGTCTYPVQDIKNENLLTIPIGRPIANAQVYILDQYLQPVPIGVSGELYIGGDGIARGYWNRPELTKEKFVPNPFSEDPNSRLYKTGDLVRYLPDGNIEFLGRIDHQVKIRGFRIELGEIEEVLKQHEAIKEAVVIVREDISRDKRLVAYLVIKEGTEFIKDLRKYVKEKLPEYMIPSAFEYLNAIPLTKNGKIDRCSLPPLNYTCSNEDDYIAPRNMLEELLVSIWTSILRMGKIGVYDNFFELGGHSLLATKVISRINKDLKIQLPLRTLFDYPTVDGIAEEVKQVLKENKSGIISPIKLAPRDKKDLPLSFSQQRLWFLDQYELDSTNYNVPFAIRINGSLNVEALEKSINTIVKRHEILRTIFKELDGQPVQVVMPYNEVEISIINLTEESKDKKEVNALELVQKETRFPFDLSKGPLFRVGLIQLSDLDYVLYFNIHHIIFDGWSRNIIINELEILYEDFSKESGPSLPELQIQYGDYTCWQRENLLVEELNAQLSYWMKKLDGELPILQLPTDRPRPAMETLHGASYSLRFPQRISKKVKELSQKERSTAFMVYLAAFKMLLYKYTGQEDLIVGTPIAGRIREEIEKLIGFFVNTLVIRTDLSGNPTYQEYLNQIREVCLEAYANQDIPFERLVEELNPERNASQAPLFQVMFSMQNISTDIMKLSNLNISPIEIKTELSKFDLSFDIVETEDIFTVELYYNTDLFDKEIIKEMVVHYQKLLEEILTDPKQRIRQIILSCQLDDYTNIF
ncbi:non-ribosomal peptide synthetase [Bacillus cereus]|uniref:non-ribosomal peptide synthetase n=1 Tax=Bacillus cereus TaxID=1396 RepID=UPI001878FF7B|nr:non-ribosomal peptide synthetase [Bacillus cereus]MBE7122190.1 amino acid adenylation domain-containing protein [Bacillus cereus]